MAAVIQGIFALSIAATGWYYMFYSRAAERLAQVEAETINHRRVRLRQVGGFFMLLLGIFFFAGFYSVDQDRPTAAFFVIWTAVCLLVMIVLVLGLADLRLTWRLRRNAGTR